MAPSLWEIKGIKKQAPQFCSNAVAAELTVWFTNTREMKLNSINLYHVRKASGLEIHIPPLREKQKSRWNLNAKKVSRIWPLLRVRVHYWLTLQTKSIIRNAKNTLLLRKPQKWTPVRAVAFDTFFPMWEQYFFLHQISVDEEVMWLSAPSCVMMGLECKQNF